jgi:V-type H+-transporting ATPase subunit a
MHGEVTARLRELHTTIEAGERHRDSVLQNIAFNFDQWSTQVGRGQFLQVLLSWWGALCGLWLLIT